MSFIERFDGDNLIADDKHTLATGTVTVKGGEGELKRGTVLDRDENDKFVVADEDAGTAEVILADDVDATGTSTVISYEAVTPEGTEDPKDEGWYVKDGDDYVLTTDTEVESGTTYYEKKTTITALDVVANVYVSGDFKAESLIVADSYTLTEADKVSLKNAGIYIVAGL